MSKLEHLYEQMSLLTKEQCKLDCYTEDHIGGCCSKLYCRMAKNICERQGHIAPEFFRDGTYLNPDGSGCIIAPHFRPLCTLHVCEKSFFNNREFTKKYFRLRDQISNEESVCNPMSKKHEKLSTPINEEKDVE